MQTCGYYDAFRGSKTSFSVLSATWHLAPCPPAACAIAHGSGAGDGSPKRPHKYARRLVRMVFQALCHRATATLLSSLWRALAPVCKLYRYGSFWLIKPKACTNQKVVRDTSCLTEIKASRSAFLVAKSAKSAKYRVFCGYTWKNPGIPG